MAHTEISGCAHETVRRRLEQLHEAGRLNRLKAELGGWNACIWSVASGEE